MLSPLEIDPQEVKRRLDAGENLRLVDVREPHEFSIARIGGGELIPMRTMPVKLEQLRSSGGPIILYCHHGVRSLNVVYWLREQGIENCQSMAGGIDAWSLNVDGAVPRY